MTDALIYQKMVSTFFFLPFSWVLTTRNLGVGSRTGAFWNQVISKSFLFILLVTQFMTKEKEKRLAGRWRHANLSIIFFNSPLLSNTSVPDSYPVAIYGYLKWEEWEKIGVIGRHGKGFPKRLNLTPISSHPKDTKIATEKESASVPTYRRNNDVARSQVVCRWLAVEHGAPGKWDES